MTRIQIASAALAVAPAEASPGRRLSRIRTAQARSTGSPRPQFSGLRRMQEPLQIGGVTVEPGARQTVQLPIPRLYNRAELSIPVRVLHGRRPGPRLLLCAAIHGNEINGTEIIQRVLNLRGYRRLAGTLIAAPVINVYGLITESRYLPDGRDLNRHFPGSDSGSLTSRLAKVVMDELVSRATHVIDFHTGGMHRSNLPQVRVTLAHEPSAKLAESFGAPVILDANIREGSLRKAAMDRGIPIIVYETGEAMRFDTTGIRAGVRGVVRVMRSLGMLKGRNKERSPAFYAKGSTWLRAPISGVFRSSVRLGQAVAEGQSLGTVTDPLGSEDPVAAASPRDGIVIGRSNVPLVHQGDPLMHVAYFDDSPKAVAAEVSEFRNEVRTVSDHAEEI